MGGGVMVRKSPGILVVRRCGMQCLYTDGGTFTPGGFAKTTVPQFIAFEGPMTPHIIVRNDGSFRDYGPRPGG